MRRKAFDIYNDRGLRGWLVDTAKRNYWKVESHIGLDDLIQEGYLAYAICNSRYRSRVKNKSHFMALFKRVFYNRITDMANKRSRTEEAGLGEIAVSQIALVGREEGMLEMLGDCVDGEAELLCLISQSSTEVQNLLQAFAGGRMTAPRLVTKSKEPSRACNGQFAKKIGKRETNNEFYNRILGTKGVDYAAELHAIFSQPRADWSEVLADIARPLSA